MSQFELQHLTHIRERFSAKAGVPLTDITKVEVPRPRLQPLRILAVALSIALLMGVAVAATAAVRRASRPGGNGPTRIEDADEVYYETDMNGSSGTTVRYTLTVPLPLSDTPPTELEAFFLPAIPEGYVQTFGHLYDGLNHWALMSADYAWSRPGTDSFDIWFEQESITSLETGVKTDVVYGKEAPTITETAFGGVSGVLVDPSEGQRVFFWTDGSYVFTLRISRDITDEMLHGILGGLRPVEDIAPYLPSMTEEEIEVTLS